MKMKHFITVPLILLAAGALLLAGCSRDSQNNAGNDEGRGYLTIKGSDTMVHLLSTWAESFMDSTPAEVSVTGGGSGTGIAALLNGTTDICAASREIKDKELQLANDKGITPIEIAVALDGIVVVVNPANPVNDLTVEQIGKIFSGAITSWDQVGGPAQPILLLSRESSSGTYVFFQETVLNKADYSPKARLMPGTSAVVQAVTADKWSIGYVGLGYSMEAAGEIKTLAVRPAPEKDLVSPSIESIKNGSYPIARALYFYTNGEPQGLVKAFIDFCLSPAGQKIVQETGYVQVN